MNQPNTASVDVIQERLERYLSLLGCTPDASVAVLSALAGEFADSRTEETILRDAFARLNTEILGDNHSNPAARIRYWIKQGGSEAAAEHEDFEHRGWCYPPITRTLMAPPRRRDALRSAVASSAKTA